LVLLKAISLPGIEGRVDHMCVDPQNERLYVAALTNDSLEVIDLKLGKRVRSLPGPSGIQGVAIVPESHEVVVASGEDGVCRIFDQTFNLVRILNELKDADNVRYDSTTKRIYLGYGNALAVIDPKGPTKVAEATLSGHPESLQVESNGSNVYVNLPETRQIAVINKDTAQVTAFWPVLEARENFPMALDEENHRLFIGCRKPAKVLIYDTERGSYVGKVDCVGDADDLHYDKERKLIYVTGGQGYITVIHEVDPYLYKVVANISTAPGARTSHFEPDSGTLYVAVPHRRKQPAEIWVYKARP
jgi:DNA-binding beta-propeller fold protein YncE